ncbi:MAG: 50S ribosomal protein L4 [Patescibacteria group bacterium]|jgi:large subunit ribosomal protein L4
MIKANVYNTSGEVVKELELNPAIFEVKVKPELVTQAIITLQANSRQVLAHTKDKSEVRGGGKKPWKQKGTGRARHGSIRSPLWRGGGITFGPTKERNFSIKMNKKANRKAILMGLSDKAANDRIILVDKIELTAVKTKKFFEILRNLNLRSKKKLNKKDDKIKIDAKDKKKKESEKSILVVMPKKDQNIWRAAKNISKLNLILADSLNVLDIVKYQYILMSVDSIAEIEKTFIK